MILESDASMSLLAVRVVLGEVDVTVHDQHPVWRSGRPWPGSERLVRLRLGPEPLALGTLFVHGGQLVIRITQVEESRTGALADPGSRTHSPEGV